MHVATYTRTFYVRQRFNDGPGTAGEWGLLGGLVLKTAREPVAVGVGRRVAEDRAAPTLMHAVTAGLASRQLHAGLVVASLVGAAAVAVRVLCFHVSLLCVVENLNRLSRGSGFAPRWQGRCQLAFACSGNNSWISIAPVSAILNSPCASTLFLACALAEDALCIDVERRTARRCCCAAFATALDAPYSLFSSSCFVYCLARSFVHDEYHVS